MVRILLRLLMVTPWLLGLPGCESRQPGARAGAAIDRAGTQTGQAVGRAAASTGAALGRAGEWMQRRTE